MVGRLRDGRTPEGQVSFAPAGAPLFHQPATAVPKWPFLAGLPGLHVARPALHVARLAIKYTAQNFVTTNAATFLHSISIKIIFTFSIIGTAFHLSAL